MARCTELTTRPQAWSLEPLTMTLYWALWFAVAAWSRLGVTNAGTVAVVGTLIFGPAASAPIGAHSAIASAKTTSRAMPPVRLPHNALDLVPSPEPGVQPAFGPRRSEFTIDLLLSRIHAGPQWKNVFAA